MKKIGLFVDSRTAPRTGPYKVFVNLKKGLEESGHQVLVNQYGDLTGCLQEHGTILSHPSKLVVGPNVAFYRPEFLGHFTNFVAPSQWVVDVYNGCLKEGQRIIVWSVGIDTDAFNVDRSNTGTRCLLYTKNRDGDAPSVRAWLESRRVNYIEIKYGQYTEDQFKDALSRCRYAILLTHTESQGIAYMEILAAGLPCFVFNQREWNGHRATSVPYFDERCGRVSSYGPGRCDSEFIEFLSKLDEYRPREYVLENHTLKHGAQNYVRMLEDTV